MEVAAGFAEHCDVQVHKSTPTTTGWIRSPTPIWVRCVWPRPKAMTRSVVPEDHVDALDLLDEGRMNLSQDRTRAINQLHRLLRELLAGGIPTNLAGVNSDLQIALVCGYLGRGHQRRRVAGQPYDDVGDQVRVGQRVRGQRAGREAVDVVRVILQDLLHRHVVAHRGVGAVGVHRVHPDPELAQFDRQ